MSTNGNPVLSGDDALVRTAVSSAHALGPYATLRTSASCAASRRRSVLEPRSKTRTFPQPSPTTSSFPSGRAATHRRPLPPARATAHSSATAPACFSTSRSAADSREGSGAAYMADTAVDTPRMRFKSPPIGASPGSPPASPCSSHPRCHSRTLPSAPHVANVPRGAVESFVDSGRGHAPVNKTRRQSKCQYESK